VASRLQHSNWATVGQVLTDGRRELNHEATFVFYSYWSSIHWRLFFPSKYPSSERRIGVTGQRGVAKWQWHY
jgi:hypothetical protein